MENVIPMNKTDEDKLTEMHKECSRLFFEYGQLAYEIECKKTQLGELEVKLRNANTEAYKLSHKMRQEAASKMKVEEPNEQN